MSKGTETYTERCEMCGGLVIIDPSRSKRVGGKNTLEVECVKCGHVNKFVEASVWTKFKILTRYAFFTVRLQFAKWFVPKPIRMAADIEERKMQSRIEGLCTGCDQFDVCWPDEDLSAFDWDDWDDDDDDDWEDDDDFTSEELLFGGIDWDEDGKD